MDVSEVIAKARVLLEALPYIQDFRGSTFVVKYGGSFMDDPNPEVRNRVATDIAFLAAVGINVVVVHGGGKAISRAMDASGLKASFVNGLRVTDEPTIAIVKQTLDEIVNKDVCDTLAAVKARPKGLPGDSVASQSDSLARSTANGFLSTPYRHCCATSSKPAGPSTPRPPVGFSSPRPKSKPSTSSPPGSPCTTAR